MSRRARTTFLLAVVAVSMFAHVWGIRHDLPVPQPDERYFVEPAVYVAASGDLDPHWLGHPGSTVIYPLALLYRAREVVFHGAPVVGEARSVAVRFRRDPSWYFLAGRLWVALFSVASLVVVFAVARRVFGDLAGAISTAIWAVVPLGVGYGRIVRTDSIGLFLTLLVIWSCLRLVDRPTVVRALLVGAGVGLAASTRYFLALLGVVVVTSWWSTRPRRLPILFVAGAASVVTFVATTPFFVLDPGTTAASLRNETVSPDPGRTHGWPANLAAYLLHSTPTAISWVGLIAATVGIVLALRRRDREATILIVWVAVFVVTISAMPVRWDRWLIPVLPFVVCFAVDALQRGAATVAARVRRSAARPAVAGLVLGLGVVVVAVGPLVGLVALDDRDAEASTSVLAQRWLRTNIPWNAQIASEIKGPDLEFADPRSVEHHALPSAGSIADYSRTGYRVLVLNREVDRPYLDPSGGRAAAAFYGFLARHGRVLADFPPGRDGSGPHLVVYRIPGPAGLPTAAEVAPELASTLRPGRNQVARQGGPVRLVRLRLRRLWRRPGRPDLAARART
ncbi:MAG: glycosyltransferase family 39 protein [Actinomycetes bacterium]